jgi:DNA topoisomerase-1
MWTENVMGQIKTITFSRNSFVIQNREEEKFDKARKLANNMGKIDAHIAKNLASKKKDVRMTATVCKLIRTLGIRVGDEKDTDISADTIGASTLRKEHVTVNGNKVKLDFLGKDSVRYTNETEFDDQTVANIKEFIADDKDRIFPDVTSTEVRDFLSSVVAGLSAKVFRTAAASELMSKLLTTITAETEKEKMTKFTEANLEVAKLLNHQTTVAKSFDQSLVNLETKLTEVKEKRVTLAKEGKDKQIARLEERIKDIESKIDIKKKTKEISPDIDTSGPDAWVQIDFDVEWKEQEFFLHLPVSRTRFPWTPLCPRQDRNDDVWHEEDRSSFSGGWAGGQRGRAQPVPAVHGPIGGRRAGAENRPPGARPAMLPAVPARSHSRRCCVRYCPGC